MKHRSMFMVMLLVATMVCCGCSGVRLSSSQQVLLENRIAATCTGTEDILTVAQGNAEYWEQLIDTSKELFGGVSLNATYYDLSNQKLGWTQAGVDKLQAGELSEEGQKTFKEVMCNHLTALKQASLGTK